MKVKSLPILGGILMVAIASPLNANAATPINLVSLARNGHFQEQGIPSHMALKNAVALGRINGEDVVKAAIEKNRLPAQQLNDSNYVRFVERELDFLIES